jgi:essential nuclear protein 1
MPKAKRIRSAALAAQLTRHQPLGQVLAQDAAEQAHGKLTSRKKMKKGRQGSKDGEEETADDLLLLDTKTSQRILELSKRQQLEMETEEQQQEQAATDLRRGNRRSAAPKRQNQRKDSDDDEDDEKEDDDDEAWEDDTGGDGMIVRDVQDDRYISVAEGTLSPEDEALVNAMMNPNNNSNSGQQPRQSLADLILAKIDEKESAVLALSSSQSQQPSSPPGGAALPPKVVHVYTEIGKLLSRYTSGKLPKAFKVIPSLTHWEDVLYLTRPDLWTPQAMYAATRIFASNLNPHMAQRFYNLVLLDAVRADIQHNKKLNYHYYMALKKGTVFRTDGCCAVPASLTHITLTFNHR